MLILNIKFIWTELLSQLLCDKYSTGTVTPASHCSQCTYSQKDIQLGARTTKTEQISLRTEKNEEHEMEMHIIERQAGHHSSGGYSSTSSQENTRAEIPKKL